MASSSHGILPGTPAHIAYKLSEEENITNYIQNAYNILVIH